MILLSQRKLLLYHNYIIIFIPVAHGPVLVPGVVPHHHLPGVGQVFDQHRAARPHPLACGLSLSLLQLVLLHVVEKVWQVVDQSRPMLHIKISVLQIILSRLAKESLSESVQLLVEELDHVPVRIRCRPLLHILSHELLINFNFLFEVLTNFFAFLIRTNKFREKL